MLEAQECVASAEGRSRKRGGLSIGMLLRLPTYIPDKEASACPENKSLGAGEGFHLYTLLRVPGIRLKGFLNWNIITSKVAEWLVTGVMWVTESSERCSMTELLFSVLCMCVCVLFDVEVQ